jgi:AcrR family transcriptional regulator
LAPKVSEEHIYQRKLEILKSAEEVFKRKGFEPTTMKDIVEASGMSRGGVYQYFSSTEEMLREILEQGLRDGKSHIELLIKSNEKIWYALDVFLNEHEVSLDDPFGVVTYEYFVTSWRNKERKEYLLTRYANSSNIMIELVNAGVDSGEFNPILPTEQIVSFMINVCDGMILQAALADKNTSNIKGQYESLRIYLRSVLQIKD